MLSVKFINKGSDKHTIKVWIQRKLTKHKHQSVVKNAKICENMQNYAKPNVQSTGKYHSYTLTGVAVATPTLRDELLDHQELGGPLLTPKKANHTMPCHSLSSSPKPIGSHSSLITFHSQLSTAK